MGRLLLFERAIEKQPKSAITLSLHRLTLFGSILRVLHATSEICAEAKAAVGFFSSLLVY
jgi:hypothetical protein